MNYNFINIFRSSAAAGLLRSWVRIPPGAWIFVCCECRVLSGRGLCDELINRPEKSYRLWCVVVCDLETPRMRRPWPALGRSATEKKNINIFITIICFYNYLYPWNSRNFKHSRYSFIDTNLIHNFLYKLHKINTRGCIHVQLTSLTFWRWADDARNMWRNLILCNLHKENCVSGWYQ